jgi:hypothetical protein
VAALRHQERVRWRHQTHLHYTHAPMGCQKVALTDTGTPRAEKAP